MKNSVKSLSEIATCVVVYTGFRFFEKDAVLRVNDVITIDSWVQAGKPFFSEHAVTRSTLFVQAALTYISCRAISPVISAQIANGFRHINSEVLKAMVATATPTLPVKRLRYAGIVGLGLFPLALVDIYRSSRMRQEKDIIDPKWTIHTPADILLETYLFSIYLFRRLLYLSGPIVAFAGVPISYAIAHAVSDNSRNGGNVDFFTICDNIKYALFAQVAYYWTGKSFWPFLAYSFFKTYEYIESIHGSYEASPSWKIYLAVYSMQTIGVTSDNNNLIMCGYTKIPIKERKHSFEGTEGENSLIEKYLPLYYPDDTNIYREDLADILFHIRSVLTYALYQSEPHHKDQITPPESLRHVNFISESRDFTRNFPLLLAIDTLYYHLLNTYQNGNVIPKNEVKSMLIEDVNNFCINQQQLKLFENKFQESILLWDVENNKLTEHQINEIVDSYFKSILQSILQFSLHVPQHQRLDSLPYLPDNLLEGITVTPTRSSHSSHYVTSSTNTLMSSQIEFLFQEYCFAIRRAAMTNLLPYGLTIRKWNQLLQLYSTKFRAVDERKEKWLKYLNSEEFKRVIVNLKDEKDLVVDQNLPFFP